MKGLRWGGFLAFIVIWGAGGIIWFFVIDSLIEKGIETAGTKVVGARVELDGADLSLFPLGLILKGLQITDPDVPMNNAVEVSKVSMTMSGLQLLMQKTIIDQMLIDGVQLDTPREFSGAISNKSTDNKSILSNNKSVTTKKEDKSFRLPSFEIPDVREIFLKEDLQSLKLVDVIRSDIISAENKWKQRISELPDKNKFKTYQERIKKLKSKKKGGILGIVGGASDLLSLQKEIRQDLNLIKGAKQDLGNEVKTLKSQAEAISKAPTEDIRRLKEKYALTSGGLSNISRTLFGNKISDWIEKGLYWYEKTQPYLKTKGDQKGKVKVVKPLRGRGLNVHYSINQPLPDFLIKTTQVSFAVPDGNFSGQVMNITAEQDVTGLPMTFDFSGERIKNLKSVKITGSVNRVNPAQAKDQANFQVQGYEIRDQHLSKNPQFPITLKRSLVDFEVNTELQDQALNVTLSAQLQEVQISAGKPESKQIAKAFASALSDVKAFTLNSTISGTFKDYKVNLSSDLDQILKKAVQRQAEAEADKFEAKLKTAIAKKLEGPLGDIKSKLEGFNTPITQLTERLNLGNDLLKSVPGKDSNKLKLPF